MTPEHKVESNLVGNIICDNDPRDRTEFIGKLEALMHTYDVDAVDVGWRRPARSCPWCNEKHKMQAKRLRNAVEKTIKASAPHSAIELCAETKPETDKS